MKSYRLRHSVVLPDDLIAIILSFLTVKSVTRLRCVCKSWNSLISEPSFIKLHLQRSKRNLYITLLFEFGYEDFDSNVIPFPLTRLLENPSITFPHQKLLTKNDCHFFVGSCNGLLCFRSHSFYSGDISLRFHNPATNSLSKKIRVYDNIIKPKSFEDDEFGSYNYSFGYDNTKGTHKVVASRPRREGEGVEVKVFSLGDNVWRYIQDFPVVPFRNTRPICVNDGVYVSGTLNWLAIRNHDNKEYNWEFINVDQFVIITLDLGKETYRQLLPPQGFDRVPPQQQPTISALMDYLCFSHNTEENYFVIWKMKEFGIEESWIRLLKISYESLQNAFLPDYRTAEWLPYWRELFMFPVCLSENGNKLILAYEEGYYPIVYNFTENRAEQIRITNSIRWIRSKDYVESLVSTC